MEKIIERELTAFEKTDLINYMESCISESMNCLDSTDIEHIEWYKDCTFGDYFNELQELWSDEGERLGYGIDMISAKIVLTDDNKEDFENCFEIARERAYNEYIEDND